MPHNPEHRLQQLKRVLLVVDLLSPLRFGATTEEVYRDVRSIEGVISKRTVERDLYALFEIGLVDRKTVLAPSGFATCYRWVWRRDAIHSATMRDAATFVSTSDELAIA